MSGHPWWDECSGFFGDFYIQGDHSVEGHLTDRLQSLEERTQTEVDGIVRVLGLATPKQILDIPCGYGRHAIELAIRGHKVVGIDINDKHLKIARESALAQGVRLDLVKENMLVLNQLCKFDVLINMFYSFGFFESDAENLTVLRNFLSALRPGGKFLMHTDVNIPRVLNGKYKTVESRRLVDGGTLHISERYNHHSKRIEGTWTIESKGETLTKPYSVRVYDEIEFRDMCLEVGFESCFSYGDWFCEPYRLDSEEIIFVATKASC